MPRVNITFPLFWIKEPLTPPVVAAFFLHRTPETIIVLCFNLMLAVFGIHVILTKSSSLGSFKWYLINQFVVSQSLDIGILLHSPVFMGSYVAFFSTGVYTYIATDPLSYFVAFLGFTWFFHSLTSVFLSLFNRFVFIFRPHLQERLNKKKTLFYILMLHVFFDGMFAWACTASFMDHDTMVKRAHADSVLAQSGAFLVFFLLPVIAICACWAFAVDNSTNAVNIALQFFVLNGISDMLIMMYFVKPYKIRSSE
uniref:G protein-coupled receptor n=1 Tax=Panagrellus redivivus TaxID=6233 RepID=A0A7E4UYY3_PANRE